MTLVKCVQRKLDIIGNYIITLIYKFIVSHLKKNVKIRVFEHFTKSVNCHYSVGSLNGLSFKIVSSERIWLPGHIHLFQQFLKTNIRIDI